MPNPIRVVMVAAECLPFAQAGGLGDVIGALPVALEKLGVEVSVIIPRYRSIDLQRFGFHPYHVASDTRVPFGWEEVWYDAHVGTLPGSNVKVFLIGNDRFFDRDGIYVDQRTGHDFVDQADRWIFFSRATMEFLRSEFSNVDIIHCHDHQAALIPAYLRKFYRRDGFFSKTGTVYTIHNLGYQGRFHRDLIWRAGFDEAEFYPTSPFEFYGTFNFMKVGIVYGDLITTVSPTYAREIQETAEGGYGLEGVLRERSRDLIGILNGIDVDAWNPSTDPLIPAHFDSSNLEGKRADKRALLKEFGLDESRVSLPLLAMISRIELQKGFDLVLSSLDYLLSKDVSFVLLGTGNKDTESYLRTIGDRYPGKASIRLAFEKRLSHLTEAGADIFLMPSRYEPCGLNQMYSLRYGTVPVVRSTGGLSDTVVEFNRAAGEGTGFRFQPYDSEHFKDAIDRALTTWANPEDWVRLMKNGMQQDFSWDRSARRYVDVYSQIAAAYTLP